MDSSEVKSLALCYKSINRNSHNGYVFFTANRMKNKKLHWCKGHRSGCPYCVWRVTTDHNYTELVHFLSPRSKFLMHMWSVFISYDNTSTMSSWTSTKGFLRNQVSYPKPQLVCLAWQKHILLSIVSRLFVHKPFPPCLSKWYSCSNCFQT